MRPDPRRAPSRSQDRTLTLSLTIPPPLRTRREDDEECEACETVPEHVKKKVASGKLWSSSQFPAGTTGVTNWEMSNLTAAQAWECPCLDRRTAPRPAPCLCLVPPRPFPRGRHSSLVRSGTGGGARGEPGSAPQRRPLVSHDSLAAWAPLHRRNCIGGERLKILDLYEHRKAFRTSAAQGRGLRDESRAALQNHYSAGNGTFSRSFVVGPLNDCCAASAGLASGLSFHTWSDSRTDVTKNRPWHTGRGEVAAKNRSVEGGLFNQMRDRRRPQHPHPQNSGWAQDSIFLRPLPPRVEQAARRSACSSRSPCHCRSLGRV